MKKAFIILLIGILLTTIVVLSGVIKQRPMKPQGKIKITASFYPLADVSREVGGSLVEVTSITPAGAEPHDYEPTPQDMVRIYQSQLFIYNGNGVDRWAETMKDDLIAHGVIVIAMSDHLTSLTAGPGVAESTPTQNNGQQKNRDPHFWLDPLNVQKETTIIADALVKLDPSNETAYRATQQQFENQLTTLDQDFKIGLRNCTNREIITSHAAFGYLAQRYQLTQLYIAGLSPDEEPSPQTMATIATQARQKNINYIFFESLVNPKIAQTIADEIGAHTLELNPIEGLTNQQIAAGENYISIMKKNLTNLKIALACQP